MDRKTKAEMLLDQIREIKKEADVSNEKMAQKIGVSVFTLSNWLNHGLPKKLVSSVMLLTNFIEKYDEAKKSGKLDEFFPFP